jgi:hypothetical protein
MRASFLGGNCRYALHIHKYVGRVSFNFFVSEVPYAYHYVYTSDQTVHYVDTYVLHTMYIIVLTHFGLFGKKCFQYRYTYVPTYVYVCRITL